MKRHTLTVGMATHSDFDGLYFSVNALRLYHSEVLDRVDIVVVDNAPDSTCGKRAKGLFEHINAGLADLHPLRQPRSAKWIPYGHIVGTTQAREEIFRQSTTDAVLVMDSHVLLWPGALARFLQWLDDNPEDHSLFSGPLCYDNLAGVMTHFDDVWRSAMWGVWGNDPRGNDIDGEPFEIPAMGLGLFAARRESWPGFNPHFREFGGEEWYIHEKFRQAGRVCKCLPFLRWQHRFGDPTGGRKSPVGLEARVSNYIHGHLELGIPMDRLRDHFVHGLNSDGTVSNGGRVTGQAFDLITIAAAELEGLA